MIHRFRDRLREAVIHQRQMKIPNVSLIIAIAVACTLAFILIATVIIPPDATRAFYSIGEHGPITALSAILLAMASTFSLASIVVLVRANNRHIWLWIIMTLGFAFFAFDELLTLHERAGAIIERYAAPGIFRNWNDVIVILYGVAALPIMVALLPNLMRYRIVIELFAVAFVFYGIHTLIDATQEPRTVTSAILEESCKLFSVEFLAIGAFVGFLGVLWNCAPSDAKRNDQ